MILSAVELRFPHLDREEPIEIVAPTDIDLRNVQTELALLQELPSTRRCPDERLRHNLGKQG